MSTASNRQNTLFVSEDWKRAYEALSNVDFKAYDADTLRAAMINYISVNYPEEFNDWIGSSEFIIKLDILAWLSQNIAYRTDLNSRENFIAVAERRSSLLRLAQNIAFNVSRVQPATGEVKIQTVKTNQQLKDSSGNIISDKVTWNDATDPDWYEKWLTIMNAAFSKKTQFGRPLRRYTSGTDRVSTYRFRSIAPATGTYPFSANVSGASIDFDIVNVNLDPLTGSYSEYAPNPGVSAFHMLHRTDGLGTASNGTGFFLPIRQGRIGYQDEIFTDAVSMRTVNIDAKNINQFDVWVTKIADDGTVLEQWTRVDSSYGDGIAFNTTGSSNIFEVITRVDDKITIRFGDGKFGAIPLGNFRIWYRVSDPDARAVKATDIRNKTVVIPYANDGKIYNLSMTYSLVDKMTNAAPSTSDNEIKNRANKVFYTQNRMANGEDYNNFPLKDSSILKVKTVNRTFSGQGSGSAFSDPTGTYNNVKLVGADGRLYRSFKSNKTVVTADIEALSPETIVAQTLQPMISALDKLTLYYASYDEIVLQDPAFFYKDAIVNSMSRGRFVRYNNLTPYNVPVGASASDALTHVTPDAIVRLESFDGPIVRVDYTIEDGMVTSGILFKELVDDGAKIYSILPTLRQTLSAEEKDDIVAAIISKRSFGVRWDVDLEMWKVISVDDLDQTNDFSLEFAGDTTKAGKDSSWMAMFKYTSQPQGDDVWTISDRGLSIYFESDREVDFYYANSTAIVDTETGRLLRDNVKILKDNETRDSLRRRGVKTAFAVDRATGATRIVGDGTKTTFTLNGDGLNPTHVFVEFDGAMISRDDWTIINSPGLDKIKFQTPPSANVDALVRYDPTFAYLTTIRTHRFGDDSTRDYELGMRSVSAENVWGFSGGLLMTPSFDYATYPVNTVSTRLYVNDPVNMGVDLTTLAMGGSGPAFLHRYWKANGSTTSFNTLTGSDKLWVFYDGVLMRDGYSLDTSDPDNTIVVFAVAPVNNAKVDVKVMLYPEHSKVSEFSFTATSGQDSYALTGLNNVSADKVLVWIDELEGGYSYEDGVIYFSVPLSVGQRVYILYFDDCASPSSMLSTTIDGRVDVEPRFLDSDKVWWVSDVLRHSDGYVNQNGLSLTSVDADTNLEIDEPFLFRDLVIQDGVSDLVLWARVDSDGSDIWNPISETTVPRGTYEGSEYSYALGDEFDPQVIASGSVHYRAGVWLVADLSSWTWVAAPDQSAYRAEIGRGGLRFAWTHYSTDANRIDPCPTNVMDAYVLTSGYDKLVRDWIANGADSASEPDADTPDQLKIQYGGFDQFKMQSDAMIWHPARYKLIFGPTAVEQLRTKFLVVKMPGTTIPDNDLKLRILAAIDDYFSVDNWDFGSSFYYTELATYIHVKLATYIQSIVAVPVGSDQKFGRVFQARAEPDELFISSARVEDIEVVDGLTDANLRIS